MPLSNKTVLNSLLSAAAGSLLATQSASAGVVTTFDETSLSGGDFSNTLAGANDLTGIRQIFGNMDSNPDPDFITVPGLTASTPFTLDIKYNNPDVSGFYVVTVRDSANNQIGTTFFASNTMNSTGSITGAVPLNGSLFVEIEQSVETGGAAGNYELNLTAVPEPSTATVALLGAAAVALAARRKKVS